MLLIFPKNEVKHAHSTGSHAHSTGSRAAEMHTWVSIFSIDVFHLWIVCKKYW